ncbi:MAG TPA: hypothetical protein VFO96_06090 [Gemmatimonadales bacterium]|jgi:hypothetical protein|nr:hypothetical protein [Gemmatimonadales bacterium]
MTPSDEASARIGAALPGFLLATLTVFLGFALGGLFGLNEDAIKSRLSARAAAVEATVYRGDAAAADAVLAKSWTYMQRAHLHAGATGTAAVALIGMLVLVGVAPRSIRVTGILLGLGALGYSLFWLWAGFRAPALGGTGAAKESLRWLAMPSAGAILLGTLCTLVLTALAARGGRGSRG